MVYKRVRGWTSGRSLLVQTFVEYLPPGPYSGFRYVKEWGNHLLKYMKGYGNLSFGSVKRPIKGLTDAIDG